MSSRLKERVALVTGASSGIGRAVALSLSAEGAAVAVAARRAGELAATVAMIEAQGGRALAVPGDVTVETEAKAMVDETVATFGKLDVLVNNAGGIRRGLLLHELPTERWDEQIDTNLRSVFLVTRAALPAMLVATGDRAIVNISSTFAHTNAVGVSAYAAAKAGVVGLTRSLSVEYADSGIRANCICPAVVVTPLAHVDRPNFDEQRSELEALHPLGRLGQPEDIAAAVLYLASAESAWVTGTVTNVDGGYTVR
jgi:NAD(P)-dependent dehydrogenase (short-subunit alcohol dehydrogenase family)